MFSIHDDFNPDKMCNYANPTYVRFVYMYEPCFLVTRDVFYVTSNRDSRIFTLKEKAVFEELRTQSFKSVN